ncbi:S46 family peptidase [Telmatobacter sp. DSM 110680]|uniref:Dipeptidyl-peptidase n=1 Tax=Telmatobacter sp. DSM 110680 TaxID=3036704 RepID=A0AAU7DI54_9BACT
MSYCFRRCVQVLVVALLAAAPVIRAEEGMWTFDNPPLKQLAAKYNFHPTQEWLDHLRLSSVRLNDGGSGSFVSPDGLLLTNHHVARGQLQKNSTAEHDYLLNGFYAATPDQEMKSPDLEINVLVSMEDVTAKVQGAAKGVSDEKQALKAREAAIAAITKEGKDKTGLRSDVVSFYNGGEYWLYQYKVYTDVRLVFAPEQQAAFFGGDPDNFTYPRYDLDMALFRVYDNGKPLHTDNFLKWSAKGAAPGELIFISGHPGSTSRQDTMAQLLVERDVVEPAVTDYLKRRIAAAQEYAAKGPEQARQVGSTIFGLQNSLKVYVGRTEALADKNLIAKKQADEDDFRKKVAANPEWQKEFGGAWETIAKAEELVKPEFRYQIYRRTDSRLFSIALLLVQYAAEMKKPDGERLAQFHDANLQSLKFQLLSPAPITTDTEKLFMKTALGLGAEKLGKDDPYVQAVLHGGPVDTTVDSMVDGTKLGDVAVRKALMDGGEAAIAASTDPMIVAARRVDPIVRASQKKMRDTVSSVVTPAGEKLGKARFLVYGKNAYPDATFTLRLSYGTVDGYPYNGTVAPPITTFYGLYDRADSFGNKAPFDLTPKEAAALGKIELSTPLDFVSTGDIIGGNSGSPVVNHAGELVGLIFDGNIESLAGDFVYDGTKNRAVAVHSSGMIEGLRKLYGADALADELQGKK